MLRIIPLTLIALLAVLPFKLGALIEGFPAIAQQFDREFGRHERPWAADLRQETVESTPAPAAGTSAPMMAALSNRSLASCADPAVLTAIADQQKDLETRSRRLADAEVVLVAAEARLGMQIEQLTGLKQDIESLMKQRSSLHEEDVRRMVTIYETMKPRDAARIFNELDTDIVIDVLDRMAERRSAPILAELEDQKAREVTRILMQRRSLPGEHKTAERNPLH